MLEALQTRERAARIVTWLFGTGRLCEYRLALELEAEEAAVQSATGDSREQGAAGGGVTGAGGSGGESPSEAT